MALQSPPQEGGAGGSPPIPEHASFDGCLVVMTWTQSTDEINVSVQIELLRAAISGTGGSYPKPPIARLVLGGTFPLGLGAVGALLLVAGVALIITRFGRGRTA